MKLLSSSSVSTSKTTTTTCEGNAHTSTVSCISGMLRRLLMCSSTHASAEADGASSLVVCEREPGVVARLMGLESMPPCSTRSISRELKSTKVRNHSFREPPTFMELEDENYFILSFESREIVGSKQRRNEMQASKQQRRRKEKQSVYPMNKENLHVNYKIDDQVIIMHKFQKHNDSTNILQPTHNSLQNRSSIGMEVVKSPKSIKLKQDTEGEIRITRRGKKKKYEIFAVEKPLSESDSEKSSPNSVLDFVDTQNSEKLTNSKSRRTLSEELENYRKLNLIGDNNGVENKRSSEGICGQVWKKDKNNVLLWRGTYRLAERETVERKWVQKEICKCNEIGWAIGLEILDNMLEELVDQLILHM